MIEEFGEGLAALLRVLRGVGEFLQVLDAGEGFGRGLFFEGADVAAAIVEELDEFGEGGWVAGFAEAFVLVRARSAIMISAARSGVVLAERLRTTGAKGLKSAPMAWAASVSRAFSGAMVEISSVGPKSKPKLKLVSKEVSGSVAADSSVTDSVANSSGLKSASASARLLAASSHVSESRRGAPDLGRCRR